jgi:hypothetical protein
MYLLPLRATSYISEDDPVWLETLYVYSVHIYQVINERSKMSEHNIITQVVLCHLLFVRMCLFLFTPSACVLCY